MEVVPLYKADFDSLCLFIHANYQFQHLIFITRFGSSRHLFFSLFRHACFSFLFLLFFQITKEPFLIQLTTLFMNTFHSYILFPPHLRASSLIL